MTSVDDLRKAAGSGTLEDVAGFGPKAQENVLAGLAPSAGATGLQARVLLSQALAVGDAIVAGLRPFAKRVELAGQRDGG